MAIQPNPATKDFLLMEYQQIAAAHFQDQTTKINLYQYYVALVTVPISLIAAAIGLRGSTPELSSMDMQEIGVIVIIVSVAAFMLMNMIMDVRFEALTYAKTVNMIRKWFYDNDNGLKGYLVLPITDAKPKFFGGWADPIEHVGLAATLDGMLLGLGVWFISQWIEASILFGASYFAAHLIYYAIRARLRDKGWQSVAMQTEAGANIN
jgi:hypothetical protein